LITAALGLTALVDLVVVKGDVGRMNTVFKFGLHSWTLFALGVSRDVCPGSGAHSERGRPENRIDPRIGGVVRGVLMTLGIAALVYPLTATPSRIGDRWNPEAPRTLDGAAFMPTINEDE
jgi:uncharacterized membrane protein